MNVAQLIRDLQAMPNQHAEVCVVIDLAHDIQDFSADVEYSPVDSVRHEGAFVALELK